MYILLVAAEAAEQPQLVGVEQVVVVGVEQAPRVLA
jgi:hypothetical protein